LKNQLQKKLAKQNVRAAKRLYQGITREQLELLRDLTASLSLSIIRGELLYFDRKWYVSHSGLLRIASRRRCYGIEADVDPKMTDASSDRWVFKAIVHKTPHKFFVGYGDADPSNVSPLVRGAEMRVAETRAVNRALRKAYGIGICSVEEIGARTETLGSVVAPAKLPSQTSNANGTRTVRDRLCHVIREHQLDPNLVKAYATHFCGVQALRDASRDQVEQFVSHLADWAEKDRNALLCQLNSYSRPQAGAA
jgi:hypothetical protein